jgi:hypothetical protein
MSECLSGLTGEKDYYNVVKYDISKARQIREFIESHCDLTDLKKDNKDSELRITAQQIPFNLQDKDQIKQLGAKYDSATKSWCSKRLLNGFEKYLVL